jgi:hypothetical protein
MSILPQDQTISRFLEGKNSKTIEGRDTAQNRYQLAKNDFHVELTSLPLDTWDETRDGSAN